MKNPETALIGEWIDKWALFRSLYLEKTGRVTIRNSHRIRRVSKNTRWKMFSTQSIRREMTRSLGDLYDMAMDICKSESIEDDDKEKWFRLCAYIAQTINTFTRTYDKMKIEDSIKKLETYVKENIEA